MARRISSRLTTLAQRSVERQANRARAQAIRKFARTPVGQMASRIKGGQTKRISSKVRRLLDQQLGSGLARQVSQAGGVEQYVAGKAAQTALDWAWRSLGPAGTALRALLGAGKKASGQANQLKAAVELLKTFGYDIKAPASKGSDRDIDKIMDKLPEILEEAEPKDSRGLPSVPGLPPARDRRPDKRRQPPEIPEAVPANPRVRGPTPGDLYMSPMMETRDSSNVFGFQYDFVQQILYIRYKAPGPAVRKRPAKRRDGKTYTLRIRAQKMGSMYAYGGSKNPVPRSVFDGLVRARSKGTFIWDNIRERGSIYGHQYTYRLVQGFVQAGRQTYIPRKATKLGFRERALVPRGGTWESAYRSTLPERLFRAAPDRGEPNRGQPNRGN